MARSSPQLQSPAQPAPSTLLLGLSLPHGALEARVHGAQPILLLLISVRHRLASEPPPRRHLTQLGACRRDGDERVTVQPVGCRGCRLRRQFCRPLRRLFLDCRCCGRWGQSWRLRCRTPRRGFRRVRRGLATHRGGSFLVATAFAPALAGVAGVAGAGPGLSPRRPRSFWC